MAIQFINDSVRHWRIFITATVAAAVLVITVGVDYSRREPAVALVGQLYSDQGAVDGLFDLRAKMYDISDELVGELVVEKHPVRAGKFRLSIPQSLSVDAVWLEFSLRASDSGAYQQFGPRHALRSGHWKVLLESSGRLPVLRALVFVSGLDHLEPAT
ncbi:MAG: hypothetical protein DHS20C11_18540 [Lysobacteraceae bacterium]|nr:MAG: hypothetical protein DHS20C11_18540 [Xanthomonadaceae bacterium]